MCMLCESGLQDYGFRANPSKVKGIAQFPKRKLETRSSYPHVQVLYTVDREILATANSRDYLELHVHA